MFLRYISYFFDLQIKYRFFFLSFYPWDVRNTKDIVYFIVNETCTLHDSFKLICLVGFFFICKSDRYIQPLSIVQNTGHKQEHCQLTQGITQYNTVGCNLFFDIRSSRTFTFYGGACLIKNSNPVSGQFCSKKYNTLTFSSEENDCFVIL